MNTKSKLVGSICLVTLLSFFATRIGADDDPDGEFANPNQGVGVSIIKLIAHPQVFHERQFVCSGVVAVGHESTAIYLDQISYEYGITANSIWLDFSKLSDENRAGLVAMEGKIVTLFGRFDGTKFGHFSLHSGTIIVERISVRPKLPRAEGR